LGRALGYCPFSRLNQPWYSSLSSQRECSSYHQVGGPLLSLLWFIDVFLMVAGPRLDIVSRRGLIGAK